MRFRQVHLDFHTSEAIPGIGAQFHREQFQAMLRAGHVDSVTVFAKCHHGWAYHPSRANETHPHLSYDLLGEMIDAAHAIGVKTPVYLSAGLDEKMARRRPDWLIRSKDERTNWAPDFMSPGYHQFCMNTPYLDYLIAQIEEVTSGYDVDGIFLDIAGVRECYCQHCIAAIREQGGDPRDNEAMKRLWESTYKRYAEACRSVIHGIKPGLPIFQNGGHITRGRRDLIAYNTHLELESLPTGGWGYDHFPLSARYVQPLGVPFLGQTGKFHTSWGEFGGYKHPNALRYETALSLANGARCSIGDQLHPNGMMDEATYALIGQAYREVEAKEPWCSGVENVADIALLSLEAVSGRSSGPHASDADAGAVRMLLEGHYLFDVIDPQSALSPYKIIILPDRITVSGELKGKLLAFVEAGGKVLATGSSGLTPSGDRFHFELGAVPLGANTYQPSYVKPAFDLPAIGNASFVMYGDGWLTEKADNGEELAEVRNPYFNRDIFTFCSHQHTPSANVRHGAGMTEGPHGIYIGWAVFEDYAQRGSLHTRELVCYSLDRLLGERTLTAALPAQGITTLQHQSAQHRLIHHLLYASPVRRGNDIEVIEDIVPLYNIEASVRMQESVKRVYLAPQMTELPYTVDGGRVSYTVPLLECHQMVVLEY